MRESRRDEILDLASAAFATSGYAATSLRDVADACAIQPGSLYHHFESKEAIVVELVERYQADLDRIGALALDTAAQASADSVIDQILALGRALAECALTHQGALEFATYEPPAGASERLVELTRHRPRWTDAALSALVTRAQDSGAIRAEVEAGLLAEQLAESMRHIGVAGMHQNPRAGAVATILCRMMLDGVAIQAPDDAELDRSSARSAADEVVRRWSDPAAAGGPGAGAGGREVAVLAAARAEFARRGYDATTVRDIAAAAGMRTGSVYRFVESKAAMFETIMRAFHARLSAGYAAVLASDSSTVEKLDALVRLNLTTLEYSPEEFAIQRAWRQTAAPAGDLDRPRLDRVRQIRSLVAEGLRCGELRAVRLVGSRPLALDETALCYRDLMWPGSIVELAGTDRALQHSRAVLLRGGATLPPS